MSAAPKRHLALVDLETGERVESHELGAMQHELGELKTKFKMAQRDVASKNLRIAGLEADKARDRLDYERYADVERIATYWHKKVHAGNKRINPMSPDRFDAIRGILEQVDIVWEEPAPGKKRRTKRQEPKYSLVECKAAIDGNAFDHFVKKRRNGSEQHFTDLEFVFRNSHNFEECRARCPYDWTKVDVTPRNAHTHVQVPTTPAGSAGQALHGGQYGSKHALGGRVVREPLRVQGRRLLVREWLDVGVAGQPSA